MNSERKLEKSPGRNANPVDWFELLAWLAVIVFCILFWAGIVAALG